MLVYELLQNENQKDIKGHTKRQSNLLLMNTETNINNLKHELLQLQEIYKNLDNNIDSWLNSQIFLSCFYMERDHIIKSHNIYKDTDIISIDRNIYPIDEEFINVSLKLKDIINKIIREFEKKANKDQLSYIDKIKNSKFYKM